MKKNRTIAIFFGILTLLLMGWSIKKFNFFARGGASDAAQSNQNLGVPAGGVKDMAVQVFTVHSSSFTDAIDGLVGTVKGDTLELAFNGNQEEEIIAIPVKVGQSVVRGQVLVEMDHTRSLSRKNQAQNAYDRAVSLNEVGGGTQADVKDAQSNLDIARKDYQDTFIHAPKSGYVSEISKQVGESVNRNENVVVLVSMENKFYLETGVNETQIEKIKSGQKAYVKIDALADGKEHETTVLGMSHEVTVTGRSGTVQVALPESIQKRLRPGLSAQCKIVCFSQLNTRVVPSEAYDYQKKGIYSIEGSSVVFKPVALGYCRRDYFQVLDGVQDQDRIVSSLVTYPVTEATRVTVTGENLEYKE